MFVKVGQHIGALEYILPHEYVETMKVLHSQAPTSSFVEIQKVLRQDLKCDVSNDVFRFQIIFPIQFLICFLHDQYSQMTYLMIFLQHLLEQPL